jgi:putative methionine-R-sulfoxide reductase with GAF domain
MVPDVRNEPCFLPNFWSTKSEIVVPIIDDEHDRVLGVINVESAKANAFGKSDRDFLEGVARIIWRALR